MSKKKIDPTEASKTRPQSSEPEAVIEAVEPPQTGILHAVSENLRRVPPTAFAVTLTVVGGITAFVLGNIAISKGFAAIGAVFTSIGGGISAAATAVWAAVVWAGTPIVAFLGAVLSAVGYALGWVVGGVASVLGSLVDVPLVWRWFLVDVPGWIQLTVFIVGGLVVLIAGFILFVIAAEVLDGRLKLEEVAPFSGRALIITASIVLAVVGAILGGMNTAAHASLEHSRDAMAVKIEERCHIWNAVNPFGNGWDYFETDRGDGLVHEQASEDDIDAINARLPKDIRAAEFKPYSHPSPIGWSYVPPQTIHFDCSVNGNEE